MDTEHILTLLSRARQDRDRAAELRRLIERLDLGEADRARILSDLTYLGDAENDFITAVPNADLIAAYQRAPVEIADPVRVILRAELKQRGLT